MSVIPPNLPPSTPSGPLYGSSGPDEPTLDSQLNTFLTEYDQLLNDHDRSNNGNLLQLKWNEFFQKFDTFLDQNKDALKQEWVDKGGDPNEFDTLVQKADDLAQSTQGRPPQSIEAILNPFFNGFLGGD